jgi:hypothetical protein
MSKVKGFVQSMNAAGTGALRRISREKKHRGQVFIPDRMVY